MLNDIVFDVQNFTRSFFILSVNRQKWRFTTRKNRSKKDFKPILFFVFILAHNRLAIENEWTAKKHNLQKKARTDTEID